jgi:hypothetical protein
MCNPIPPVVMLLLALPPTIQAQATDSVLGTWLFEQNVAYVLPGTDTVRQHTLLSELRLEQVGDSIMGAWIFDLPGRPATRTDLRGVLKDGRLRLRGSPVTGHVITSDGELTFAATTEFVLTVHGSEISGTIDTYPDTDRVRIPQRPMRGRRPAG